jgi:hypothetical protein
MVESFEVRLRLSMVRSRSGRVDAKKSNNNCQARAATGYFSLREAIIAKSTYHARSSRLSGARHHGLAGMPAGMVLSRQNATRMTVTVIAIR